MPEIQAKLERIDAVSLTDRVYLEIRKNILTRAFAPGDRLVIDQIADQLGVSLGPVREALARLSSEGLVSYERNKGYRVTAEPGPDEVAGWLEARIVFECGAVALAAARIGPAGLAELRQINAEIARRSFGPGHEPVMEFMALNAAFHDLIVRSVGNSHLVRLHEALHYGPQVSRPITRSGVDDNEDIAREHEIIIQALAAADGDAAAAAMRDHISGGARRLRQRSDGQATITP